MISQSATGSARCQSLATTAGALACVGLGCLALACTIAPGASHRSLMDGNAGSRSASHHVEDVEAERLQQLFLSSGGRDPVACHEAARALIAAGHPEESLEVLSMGLAAAPGDPDLLETQGNALAQARFRRAAERSFEDALFADPDRVSALRSLGRVRLELNRASAALDALDRCVELGARDTETLVLRSRALTCVNRTGDAFAGFAEAFAARDVSHEDLVLASALMLDEHGIDGNRRTIQAWLERAISLAPSNAQAHYYLGVVHADCKDRNAALQSWRRAVALDRGYIEALERLAECHERRGNVELAARFKRRAEKAARIGYR